MLIRLLFASFLLHAPRVFEGTAPLFFYGASVCVTLFSAFYLLWYLLGRWIRQLALVQIFGDILLETYLVYFTGGPESLFAGFYILNILSGALVLGERKVIMFLTAFSSFTYFLSSFLAYHQRVNLLMPPDPIYFFYGTAMRIAVFVTVGYLSRFLSETVRELSDRLKLSERLSSLGEVVSKIAHEVRNPLSAIRTAAEVLKESTAGKLNSQEEKMVTVVENESDRLTKTLQRILNYAKQTPPNPKMLLLDPLVERTLSVARLNFQVYSEGIQVEKEYGNGQVHIYADEEQFLGALLNLTLNAFQAMPEGGVLRINAREDLKGTKVSVEDSGGGIPREKLKDLFLPFKSSKKGGTGLGLAEVHKIVTLHEGKIEVETEPGKGTTFHLFFPKP